MLRNKKREAIKLRKDGKSYSEIKKVTGVGKGTLSSWLKDYPLSQTQIKALKTRFKDLQIERFRDSMAAKRKNRLLASYNKAKESLLPLSQRELLIAGLFLYLGEGGKKGRGAIVISNSDPYVVKFAKYWYTTTLRLPEDKVRISLQLYADMDIEAELEYWSNLLDLPKSQFWKPYIKKGNSQSIDHSGFKHGTCRIYLGDTRVHEKILMSIKAMLDSIK